jgi:hypothetical protein
VRVTGDAGTTLTALHRVCAEHPGTVPLFIHLQLAEHEVVVRARTQGVEPGPALAAKLSDVLGSDAVIDDAGRA